MFLKQSVTSGEVAMFEAGKTLLVTDVEFVMIVKECVRSMCDCRDYATGHISCKPQTACLYQQNVFFICSRCDIFQIPVLSVSFPRSNVLTCPKTIREDS